MKCSWQNRINQGKVRLSVFRYTIIKRLQLMHSNLQWTESLSQKILISTCMHHHVNAFFFLPSMQIQLWDCIFIPTEAAELCIWGTELEIHYFGCHFFVVIEALKAYIHEQFEPFFLHPLWLSLITCECKLRAQAAVFSFCWQYNNDIIASMSSILKQSVHWHLFAELTEYLICRISNMLLQT